MPWPSLAAWVVRDTGAQGLNRDEALERLALGPGRGSAVLNLAAWMVALLGSGLGWWLGDLLGGVTPALCLSALGTGLGLYYGRRWTRGLRP